MGKIIQKRQAIIGTGSNEVLTWACGINAGAAPSQASSDGQRYVQGFQGGLTLMRLQTFDEGDALCIEVGYELVDFL